MFRSTQSLISCLFFCGSLDARLFGILDQTFPNTNRNDPEIIWSLISFSSVRWHIPLGDSFQHADRPGIRTIYITNCLTDIIIVIFRRSLVLVSRRASQIHRIIEFWSTFSILHQVSPPCFIKLLCQNIIKIFFGIFGTCESWGGIFSSLQHFLSSSEFKCSADNLLCLSHQTRLWLPWLNNTWIFVTGASISAV